MQDRRITHNAIGSGWRAFLGIALAWWVWETRSEAAPAAWWNDFRYAGMDEQAGDLARRQASLFKTLTFQGHWLIALACVVSVVPWLLGNWRPALLCFFATFVLMVGPSIFKGMHQAWNSPNRAPGGSDSDTEPKPDNAGKFRFQGNRPVW